MFGLHASLTLSDQTLERSARVAKELGLGVHVHTAEALADQEDCVQKHGLRVVERLQHFGLLGKKTICAHGVHVNEHEIELLAESGTALVHNPQSNLNNAVGIAPVLKMLERGVLVGLGTDAMTVNMREEVRTSLWIHKWAAANPSVGFVEVLSLLLENNARIADRQWTGLGLGELREGGVADIVLLDYDPPTPFGEDNFLGHFAFGLAEARVRTTIGAGRILMKDYALHLSMDVERVYAKSRELAAQLWNRF